MPARSSSSPDDRRLVCLGQISGAHGVRGLVKVRSFTETPEDLVAYGPLTDAAGSRAFELDLLSPQKGRFLARIAGVADRDAAEALAGTRLYVPRDRLPRPEEEDEYYHADLIGLEVVDREGRGLGRVVAVHDFGAGDLLEVAPTEADREGSMLLPFTRAVVPAIDLAAGRLVVEPPVETAEGLTVVPTDGSGQEARAEGPRVRR